MTPAIVGIAGTALTADEAALLRRFRPAGVILFARNVMDPTQLRGLIGALRAALPAEAVLMVDQEGGRVARLRPPHWAAHPPAGVIGALHARDPAAGQRAAFLSGALIGLQCADAGFDVVAAPVLDVVYLGAHDVIGDRSFGADPAAVGVLGRECAAGLLAAGIQPVGKHVPGHGRAQADSHLVLPVVDAGEEQGADLRPFVLNAGLPWAMTAHILYPSWDADLPATLSPTVIGRIVRGWIGFEGVLVTDDLAMQALTGTPAERAQAALSAGCDVALYCAGDLDRTAALLEACPPATLACLDRLAAARAAAIAGRVALDAMAMTAERDRLLAS